MNCQICCKNTSGRHTIITMCGDCQDNYPQGYENGINIMAAHADEAYGFVNEAVRLLSIALDGDLNEAAIDEINSLIGYSKNYPTPEEFEKNKASVMIKNPRFEKPVRNEQMAARHHETKRTQKKEASKND